MKITLMVLVVSMVAGISGADTFLCRSDGNQIGIGRMSSEVGVTELSPVRAEDVPHYPSRSEIETPVLLSFGQREEIRGLVQQQVTEMFGLQSRQSSQPQAARGFMDDLFAQAQLKAQAVVMGQALQGATQDSSIPTNHASGVVAIDIPGMVRGCIKKYLSDSAVITEFVVVALAQEAFRDQIAAIVKVIVDECMANEQKKEAKEMVSRSLQTDASEFETIPLVEAHAEHTIASLERLNLDGSDVLVTHEPVSPEQKTGCFSCFNVGRNSEQRTNRRSAQLEIKSKKRDLKGKKATGVLI